MEGDDAAVDPGGRGEGGGGRLVGLEKDISLRLVGLVCTILTVDGRLVELQYDQRTGR